MIRRLLQALDADRLVAVTGAWLAAQAAPPRAIAVDGKTLRGSRTTNTTARHVLAACDQATGIVLASTDVDGETNEITRFAPLLDQIGDLRDVVITADALHCQRDPVTYRAERGAHWILTVRGNQPALHTQLTGLPWKAVPEMHRDASRGHGRREICSLKALTISTGVEFPHAARHPGPTPPTQARPAETLHHRHHLRHYRPTRAPGPPRLPRHTRPRTVEHRKPRPPGPRRHLRRGPIPDPYRHRTPGHGSPAQHRETRSLDPTGADRARWTMRWKPALNTFAITFGDRWPAAETY